MDNHYPYGREMKLQMPVRDHLRMHLLATLGIPPTWMWWCDVVLEVLERCPPKPRRKYMRNDP